MGLYTSIHFTPDDASWTAPEGFLIQFAEHLRVNTLDHLTVYRRPLLRIPFFTSEDRDSEIASAHKIPLAEGIAMQQVGSRFWTHMMFPYGEFMKELSAELTAGIPEEVYGAFCPWDSSIYNGFWETLGFDTGRRTRSGAFAFVMSADECPPDLDRYLEHFSKIAGVQKLTEDLAELSGRSWTTSINLS